MRGFLVLVTILMAALVGGYVAIANADASYAAVMGTIARAMRG